MLAKQVAKHLREVHFGGNWTCSSLREHLSELTWEQAVKRIHPFNSIATLTFHTHYYVGSISRVLKGEAVNSKDTDSFNHPPINNQADWEQLLSKVWDDAEACAVLIEQLPDEKFWEVFSEDKYGIYYRNLAGMIEHFHYHLGQIVLIKKMIQHEVHTA